MQEVQLAKSNKRSEKGATSHPDLRNSLGHEGGVFTRRECRVIPEALILEGYVETWPKEFVHIVILKLGITGEPGGNGC
ncbi:hypothetical protein E2C01_010979 [Portunus trituberculatus]|uniref:Uncharacterized protein n=1 Tax=Portunus trituberculatus TaxID=210409 RepID=A0A5B7D9T3_PORTR|nr:hypothetical protein [Portunus trituberculatus]